MSTRYPLATYRLQLGAALDLTMAFALLPYLQQLGISHLYLSPILRARTGSSHGYDVTDPRTINPQLGTEATLRNLAAAARERGMAIVLDIVPNHMATGSENPYWEDVLQHGPCSQFARWFDIDWEPSRGRVFLPTLGKRIGRAVDDDEIVLDRADGRFRIRYFDQSFPIDPATIPLVFDLAHEQLGAIGESASGVQEIISQLRMLPPRTVTDPAVASTRSRRASEALAAFDSFVAQSAELRAALSRAQHAFRSAPSRHRWLRRLLAAQGYRLAYWRRAAREINYRRFFTISHLVALRQEDPDVFAATHETLLRWVREQTIQAVRVDHVDGLSDPSAYLAALRAALDLASPPDHAGHVPVYVEKILARGEPLPTAWPIAGTTGYDFLNVTEDLFVDPAGYKTVQHDYGRYVKRRTDFSRIAVEAKRKILRHHLAADVSRLASRLQRWVNETSADAPVDRPDLGLAIVETIAHLDVYRTYSDTPEADSSFERNTIQRAIVQARDERRAPSRALDCLNAVLAPADQSGYRESSTRIELARRFQQLCVPAAAKGIEDTAFYVHVPLLSRNEVGADPQHPVQHAVEQFHEANRRRAAEWPAALLCVGTHDTKRSADLRARLDVLSELPGLWNTSIRRWRRWNRRYASRIRKRYVPDANTEYMLYQTLVGMWPLTPSVMRHDVERCELRSRLWECTLKSAREAKVHTNWVERNVEYEAALGQFVEALFAPGAERFRVDVERFVARIIRFGMWNALARTVLHLTAPGVPDIYQGDELWDFSLVDPDNRRPVDFALRQRMLRDLRNRFDAGTQERASLLRDLLDNPVDGRIKLHVIHRILDRRAKEPHLFTRGGYRTLEVRGTSRTHVVAFAREAVPQRAITVAPRLFAQLPNNGEPPVGEEVWTDTAIALPPGWEQHQWYSVLAGVTIPRAPHLRLADLLAQLPVAVLIAADTATPN